MRVAEAAEPLWLTPDVLLALRDALLADYGPFMPAELDAPARAELLQALDVPRQRWLAGASATAGTSATAGAVATSATTGAPPLDELAAALGFALTRCTSGHPCLALAAVDVFLRLNGQPLQATEGEAAGVFGEAASGLLHEYQMLKWLRRPGMYLWPVGAEPRPPSGVPRR